MTISPDVAASTRPRVRTQRVRHYVMTRPTFFTVEYAINPWMDPATPVDPELAVAQWETLRETYRSLGHTVDLVDPVPGLPDMVFAANAGLIINGAAIVARFKHAERDGESVAYASWMDGRGHQPVSTRHVNEGQGDLLVAGSMILAGTGFRTDPQAHFEVAAITGMPVVSLELVDPRFYHLDTALTVLDDTTIAYYPPAFTDRARPNCNCCSPTPSRCPAPTPTCSGSTRCPTASTSCTRHRPPASPNSCTTPDSIRSVSICPNCSRAGGSVKCCTLEVFS